MTWYASHVYGRPTPSVILALSSVASLSKGLFIVKDLESHRWSDPEGRHGLPTGGLLVCRELCELNSHEAEWHGKDGVSWDSITGPSGMDVISPTEVSVFDDPASLPPIEFLRFLKWVSTTSRTVISFYHHFMWGGDTFEEFAWIFGAEDRLLVFKEYETVIESWSSRSREITSEHSLLRLTLEFHELALPTPYFALHSRSLDWQKYRLGEVC